jgi:hypothetical protein
MQKKSPETEPRKPVTVRTQQSVNISLHQYAEFLGCSLDHVVVKALNFVFRKDTDFQKWASENPMNKSKQPRSKEPQTAEQHFLRPIIANPTQQMP